MPELPEVEFCARCLERWTRGRRVIDAALRDPRAVALLAPGTISPIGEARRARGAPRAAEDAEEELRATVTGAPPERPLRHGKRLLWPFGGRALLVHLGMTGKWTRTAPGAPPDEATERFGRLRLTLDDGTGLAFVDPRVLGVVCPVSREDGLRMLTEGLGPDALVDPLPRLVGPRAVKVALLDQSLVAGIGNVQAMEALWRAGIHPATPCDALTEAERSALDEAVHDTLADTLATLGDADTIVYVDESLVANPFAIYRRAGTPCPRCKTSIERLQQSGRSTYWCPRCQTARRR